MVIFVIIELGPDLESLWKLLLSKSMKCGVKAFFTSREAAGSCRTVGRKKIEEEVTYGFWIIVASLLVLF